MAIEISEPGLYTTVQDLGRPGYYSVGIPPGGALDRGSAIIANALVGNPSDAAVLECTYLGPKFTVTEASTIAIVGASVQLTVNGEPRDSYTAVALAAGDEVAFGYITAGARYYIAVAGGIDVPVVLGSRSTYSIGSLGGLESRALKAGDALPVGAASDAAARAGVSLPEALRPQHPTEIELRVMLGLYDHRLTEAGRDTLLSTPWKLSGLADRMGMRFAGAVLEWEKRTQPFGAGSDPSNIVDAGYPIGSIQVPGGNEPIVLHRDAVSGGGYAMVATVISPDLDVLAQAMPGTTARFVEVDMDEALRARAASAARIREAVAAIG